MQQSQIKIAQFQWYQVETKVRQYVHQLLQPFQKKQIEETAKITDLKKQLMQHRQKIKEHTFLLTKSKEIDEKPPYFLEVEGKMKGVLDSLADLKGQYNKDIQNIKGKLLSYDQKMHKTETILAIAEQQRRARINDKEQINNKLQKQIKGLMQNVEIQNQEINSMNQKFKNQMHKIEQKVLVAENKLTEVLGFLKGIENQVKILRSENFKLDARFSKIQTKNEVTDKRVKTLEDSNDIAKKFVALVQVLKNQFFFIQNYIDKYLPLFVQSQISDTLDSCLTGNTRTKLCLYQEKVYNTLNERIIMHDNNTGLQENIQHYMSVIQRIILRNKRYVIKLKVDKLIQISKNFSYNMHIYDGTQEDKSNAQLQSINLSKNLQKNAQVIIPDERIKEIVLENWKNLESTMTDQIKQAIKTTKQWLKDTQENVDMRVNEIEIKLESNSNQVKKIETDFKLETTHLQKQIDKFRDTETDIKNNYNDIKNTVKQLTHFASIVNHLIIQDQIDRQGIALYGLRETFKEKEQPNISLENKCFSCSGFPASTLSAFKMACLAYNPSNVFVQGKLYKRQQILQMATKILHSIKEALRQQKQHSSIPQTSDRKQLSSSQKEKGEDKFNTSHYTTRNFDTTKTIFPVLSNTKRNTFTSRKKNASNDKNNTSQLFYY